MAEGADISGQGISIWLVPDSEEEQRLSTLIASLARRLDTPRFEPHVTLLPGLRITQGDALRRAAEVAAAVEALELPMRPLQGRDEVFRCVYIPVGETLKLLASVALVRLAFDEHEDRPFEPHLSLVYGRLKSPERGALIAELEAQAPKRIRFERLDVVHTEGPVASWRRLRRFDLQAANRHE